MKKAFTLLVALLTLTLVSPVSAKEGFYPPQDPSVQFEVPVGWNLVNQAEQTIVGAKSGRVSVIFTFVQKPANMELFNAQLALEKRKGAWQAEKVVDEPATNNDSGLTAYIGTFEAKMLANNRVHRLMLAVFDCGGTSAVVCRLFVREPASLSKTDLAGVEKFAQSLKAYKP